MSQSQSVDQGSDRPTGVLIFAVLNLLFGISGLFGTLVVVALTLSGSESFSNPLMDAVRDNATFRWLNTVLTVVDFVFAGVLVAAGVGLLKMAAWGRKLSLVFAAYKIVAVIFSSVLNVMYVFLPVVEQTIGVENEQMVMLVASITGGIGGCLRLIYPVALLIYFGLASGRRLKTASP